MRGLLGRLFGKRKLPGHTLQTQLLSIYDPSKQADRLGLALLANLQKQLDLLGSEIGQVPPVEPFISAKCRGYLYGLSVGILSSEGIELSRDAVIDTLIAAFALIYGDEAGRDLSLQTAQEVEAGNPAVIWASDWAIAEIRGVYDSGGITSAAGFYLAANGMI
jgi:hypothetical protein